MIERIHCMTLLGLLARCPSDLLWVIHYELSISDWLPFATNLQSFSVNSKAKWPSEVEKVVMTTCSMGLNQLYDIRHDRAVQDKLTSVLGWWVRSELSQKVQGTFLRWQISRTGKVLSLYQQMRGKVWGCAQPFQACSFLSSLEPGSFHLCVWLMNISVW